MRRFALILLIWPGVLIAQELQILSGPQILNALSGRTVKYDNGATQVFEPSMSTQYFSGRPSSGYWAIRNDKYCSLWPPSDFWACYSVQSDGHKIRFVGNSGDVTDGLYID
ncbi:MAG: hypothetical protein ACWA49_08105 [Ruegeria sp.]